MELVDAGYSSNNFKSFLFGESVKLADTAFGVQDIRADFDKHIAEKWNADDIKQSIVEYENNVLVYLNEYLFAKNKGYDFALGAKYDIEHIMPKSGTNLDIIRKDAQIDTKEEFYDYVDMLGNKIVLESKINRSIGNEWFRGKVSTSVNNKTGYKDSKYPIATDLVKKYENDIKPYWCKQDIIDATEKAKDRITKFIFGIEE
ncbi:MAG: HNH endonuclease [Ruminococcus sp.]|nr:HNH endonuclease [Ruminococcus sp.]MBR6393644.1 HNH endonuclease [Ruminococcus sp.]